MLKKNELTGTMKQIFEEVTTFAAEDILDLDMGQRMKVQYLDDTYRAYGLNNFISLRDFLIEVDNKINKIHYGIL